MEWMIANLGLEEMLNMKVRARRNGFFKLPVGAVKKVEGIPPCLKGIVFESNPKVMYRQGDTDHCLFCSAASAFHHKNWDDVAAGVNENRQKFTEDKLEAWEILKEVIIKKEPRMRMTKLENFNPLSKEERVEHPVVATLMGDDGEVNHAVSFLYGYVFDSNLEVALPRAQAALDWCVSSPENPNVKFLKCPTAYRFHIDFDYDQKEAAKKKRKRRADRQGVSIAADRRVRRKNANQESQNSDDQDERSSTQNENSECVASPSKKKINSGMERRKRREREKQRKQMQDGSSENQKDSNED